MNLKTNRTQHEFENKNKDGAEDFLRRKTRVSKMTASSKKEDKS